MMQKLSKAAIAALQVKKEVLVLGIETSCDETSASIVLNGTVILSNIIYSQISIHKLYGGVVPEVASRNHLTKIEDVVKEALRVAGKNFSDLDAIAVTYAPGLIGALMVGVSYAKGLAYSLNIPLVAVNHLEGHIAANCLCEEKAQYPYLAIVISGGHTSILKIGKGFKSKLLLETSDDAIGEAFDKVARILDLPYPGGPEIDKLAGQGKVNLNLFHYRTRSGLLSFSGLKTAVIDYVHKCKQKNIPINKADVAASFQKIAALQVADNTLILAQKNKLKTVVVCGGVAANSEVRATLKDTLEKNKIQLLTLPLKLCTDNAAMIAARGYMLFMKNQNIAKTDLTAKSSI